MRRRFRRYPLGDEGVIRFAARDTLAAFGGAQFGRCLDIDDQIDLVIDDLVDVVRVLVRHQVLAQILHHQLRITFEYVAVTAAGTLADHVDLAFRSEEHTSELQSLMRHSYAVFCLKKTNTKTTSKPQNVDQ